MWPRPAATDRQAVERAETAPSAPTGRGPRRLTRRIAASVLFCGAAISQARCASVVHGSTQAIEVTSQPSGASVELRCLAGSVHFGTTPTAITLKRRETSCTVALSAKDYEETTVVLSRDLSGWYLANILIGGVIGLLVDAADGAMFTQSPPSIHAVLRPAVGAKTPPGNNSTMKVPAKATIRLLRESTQLEGCQYLGMVDVSTPCPPEHPAGGACTSWKALNLGGDTVVDGKEPTVFRCQGGPK